MRAVNRAIEIAAEAHSGQQDRTGMPSIAHPMRVMAGFLLAGHEQLAVIAALHDVIKSADWTFGRLADEGYSVRTVEAIASLTRAEEEDYLAYVERAAANPLARLVMEADVRDQSDETRLSKLPQAAQTRLRREYGEAMDLIVGAPPAKA